MKVLTLDFETYDPSLKTYGMGWAFKLNYPEFVFDILGAAIITHDGEEAYLRNGSDLQRHLDKHDAILCHNSMYDLGCLLVLAAQGYIDFNIDTHFKLDTLILAKLHSQNYFSYGLDNLAKFFGIEGKKSDLLHDWVWSTGLYQDKQKEATGRNTHTRPSDAVLERFCKSNMNLLPHDLVAEYAIEDVRVTRKLYDKLIPKVDYVDLELYSDLQNICVDSKSRGVCIDLKRAKEVSIEFGNIKKEQEDVIYALAGHSFNINGIQKQLAPVLIELGYSLPQTEKGNYSVNSAWLDDQKGPIIDAIKLYRQSSKMKKDFIDKIIDYQEAIPEQYRSEDRGILFPTMKILGATVTGRFSSGGGSGCKEVSIQQIPSRNEQFGKPCRSIFIPFPGEKWGYGDFNSQESRLQVHYAALLHCGSVDSVVDAWNDDPLMSFHDKVASLANIDRSYAKAINLGLSYGMGETKLVDGLGLSSREGKQLLVQYHQLVPFMKQLQKKASKALKTNGYIKTIGGRRLTIGRDRGAEKDGLSKLAQGSAADQCKRAMQRAYKAGIHILFAVHDELNWSSKHVEKDLITVQAAMEGAYQLVVPVVAEMGQGDSWLEAK